jgi:dolichyl-phosphate beta-glucosyltransferase
VVIPCYNEERRLPATLERVVDYLNGAGFDYEVLAVDDGSADGTAELVRRVSESNPRVRLLQYGANQGKGYAVRHGALEARGRWILFTDADLSTPIEELERFTPHLAQDWDVVIASRALPDSRLEVHQPWWRECVGRSMNFVIRVVSGLDFADTQCGFKLFSEAAARDIFPALTVRRWMFDVEVLVIARKLGYRVRELPVRWINSPDSRVRASHIVNVFRELLHIRWHWWWRQPDRCPAAAEPEPARHSIP